MCDRSCVTHVTTSIRADLFAGSHEWLAGSAGGPEADATFSYQPAAGSAKNVDHARVDERLLSYLYRCGEKRVYGQIVTFESRRGKNVHVRALGLAK